MTMKKMFITCFEVNARTILSHVFKILTISFVLRNSYCFFNTFEEMFQVYTSKAGNHVVLMIGFT